MSEPGKKPKLVGTYIRQKREALNISQRALGQLLTPPVTTQFISNLERGVTPLPLNHVPALTKALGISEAEIMSILEKEYALKISGRLGAGAAVAIGAGSITADGETIQLPQLPVSNADYSFMKELYQAYQQADQKTRQAFATVCESILNMPKRQ